MTFNANFIKCQFKLFCNLSNSGAEHTRSSIRTLIKWILIGVINTNVGLTTSTLNQALLESSRLVHILKQQITSAYFRFGTEVGEELYLSSAISRICISEESKIIKESWTARVEVFRKRVWRSSGGT